MSTCTVEDCDDPVKAKGVCNKHYKRIAAHGDPHVCLTAGTEEERFWLRVNKTDSCWLWTGGTTGAGYGLMACLPRKASGALTSKGAHRYAYELLVGPIPDGLVLDHLCRTPLCVRPDHLEPVTHRENLRRGTPTPWDINRQKTHCVNGHPFDEVNTRIDPKTGSRSCWTCRRATSDRWNRRMRGEAS